MAKAPGDKITYTDDNNVTWQGIVINTYEDEDGDPAVTVSIMGKCDVFKLKESDL